jgi:cardiolipin synthase A/B
MINEIKKAKKFVFIEMYIFMDDTLDKHDFISVLKKKSQEGIKVVVVADSLGSFEIKKSTIKELRLSGVEFLFFSHWLRRTHRKILIIDGRTSFLGGVNIKKNSSDWLDLQIKIVSPRLTKNILRSFSYTYQMSGGKNEKILAYRKKSIFKTIRAQFLEHWPNHSIYALQAYYQEKIISAKKKITIITPYFTPPRWLMAILETASNNNVKIEIFIPRKTDISILNRINRAYINKMKSLNIDFYAQSKMNHAKILIIDDTEALVGSQNVDLASFRLNIESGIFIKDRKFIKELNDIIDVWRKNSFMMPKDFKKIPIIDRFLLGVIRFFYSIL